MDLLIFLKILLRKASHMSFEDWMKILFSLGFLFYRFLPSQKRDNSKKEKAQTSFSEDIPCRSHAKQDELRLPNNFLGVKNYSFKDYSFVDKPSRFFKNSLSQTSDPLSSIARKEKNPTSSVQEKTPPYAAKNKRVLRKMLSSKVILERKYFSL